MTMQLEDKR